MRYTYFASLTLAAILAIPASLDAKEAQGKKEKARGKDATTAAAMPDVWPRETGPGHQPADLNGDGVLSKDEWAGDDAVFRRLDRNGDGVLSKADRNLKIKEKRVHKQTR